MLGTATHSWRLVVSQVLIGLTAWLSFAPATHGSGHDAECDPAIIVHDASQHRITGDGPGPDHGPDSDHCVACHLFRLSRTIGNWRFVPQGLDAQALLLAIDRSLIALSSVVPLPARAPPVLI